MMCLPALVARNRPEHHMLALSRPLLMPVENLVDQKKDQNKITIYFFTIYFFHDLFFDDFFFCGPQM